MPDSPSIPATGWDGLPKRKPRALLVQVTKDRLRPAAVPLARSRTFCTRLTRHRFVVLGVMLTAFVTLLCLFVLSLKPSDHVQRTEHTSSSIWDKLLFQEDEGDDDGGLIGLDDNSEAYLQDAKLEDLQPRQAFCPPLSSNLSIAAKYGETPSLIRRSVLHASSGQALARILQRAKSMSDSWRSTQKAAFEGQAFRVMVIGGSVSNCRGVDRALCWHSHLMRWLSKVFPLGDAQDKTQVSYRFIDLAKSATGSTFFNYCWRSELAVRKKQTPYLWGDGPDLVIIETGINDVVFPSDFVAKESTQSYEKDFESLLRQLKDLPSMPAVIVLDAASRLLEKTQGFYQAAEFTTHLAPSVWMDVPIISAKSALLALREKDYTGGLKDLYLADDHHPNVKGHQLLADLLLAHLESIVCNLSDKPQAALPLRPSSFQPASQTLSVPTAALPDFSSGQCIQVGASGERRKPRRNRGWSRLATSRDKQYMTSSSPGSRVVYDVVVGEGGQILLSWLKSRFYSLGDAKVVLDDRKPGVRISGHWELGWSIGVPTVLFENVTPGPHSVTIEHVKPRVQNPNTAATSNFRLIAIATT